MKIFMILVLALGLILGPRISFAVSSWYIPKAGNVLKVNVVANYTDTLNNEFSTTSNTLILNLLAYYWIDYASAGNMQFNSNTDYTFAARITTRSNDTISNLLIKVQLSPRKHSEQIQKITYNVYSLDGTAKYSLMTVTPPAGTTSVTLKGVSLGPDDFIIISTTVDNLGGFKNNDKLTFKYKVVSATGDHHNYNSATQKFSSGALTATERNFGRGTSRYPYTTITYVADPITGGNIVINPTSGIRHFVPGNTFNISFTFKVPNNFSTTTNALKDYISGGIPLDTSNVTLVSVQDSLGNNLPQTPLLINQSYKGMVLLSADQPGAASYDGKTVTVLISGVKIPTDIAIVSRVYFFMNTLSLISSSGKSLQILNTPALATGMLGIDRLLTLSANPDEILVQAALRAPAFGTGKYILTNTGTVPLKIITSLSGTKIVSNEQSVFSATRGSIEEVTLGVFESIEVNTLLNTSALPISSTPKIQNIKITGINNSDEKSIILPIILQSVVNGNLQNPTVAVVGVGDVVGNPLEVYMGSDNIIKVKVTNKSPIMDTINLDGFVGQFFSYPGLVYYHVTQLDGTELPVNAFNEPYVTLDANKDIKLLVHYIPTTGAIAGANTTILTVSSNTDALKKGSVTDYWDIPKQTAFGIQKIADATSQSITDLKHTVLNNVIIYNNDTAITSASTFDVTLENPTNYTTINGFKIILFEDKNNDNKYNSGDTLLKTMTSTDSTYSVAAYDGRKYYRNWDMPKHYGIELSYNDSAKTQMLNKQIVVNFAFNMQTGRRNNLGRFPKYSALVKDNIIFNGQGDIMSVVHYQKNTPCINTKPTAQATSNENIAVVPGNCVLYTLDVTSLSANPIGNIDILEHLGKNLILGKWGFANIGDIAIVDVIGGTTVDKSSEFTVSGARYTNQFHITLKPTSIYKLLVGHKLKISFTAKLNVNM